MKNFYYVVDSEMGGKFCASVLKIGSENNLLHEISRLSNAFSVHACETRTEAEQVAELYNQHHRRNGNFDVLVTAY